VVIGMDEEGLAKALNRFGQVDSNISRTQPGTGLGLPLTKELVAAFSGTLDIKSKLGEGTTVTVRFPSEKLIC
jgi:two-component system cell cycle sensor histidine kinase PleC